MGRNLKGETRLLSLHLSSWLWHTFNTKILGRLGRESLVPGDPQNTYTHMLLIHPSFYTSSQWTPKASYNVPRLMRQFSCDKNNCSCNSPTEHCVTSYSTPLIINNILESPSKVMILGDIDILLLEDLPMPSISSYSKASFWTYYLFSIPVSREILARVLLQYCWVTEYPWLHLGVSTFLSPQANLPLSCHLVWSGRIFADHFLFWGLIYSYL